VDIVFVDGKIAADRSAILIIKVKRINSNTRSMALVEDENDKTRVLDYGADELMQKTDQVTKQSQRLRKV
jgi:hypothetical protein